jgi:tRNA (cytidine32/uridine32-2'-O)-methyltransferase
MNPELIRIVLVSTSHPGNIGSSARAMKTMGLSRLYLVNPKVFPDRHANELAAGADNILENAKVTLSLEEALQGSHLVFGTSARAREMAIPGFTPATCAHKIAGQASDTEIAIVFGREHAGLTNEELLQCHYHLHIPTDPAFASLNLAQAVQIVAYELRMALLSPAAIVKMQEDKLARIDDVERFYTHLQQVLVAIRFLNPSHPKRLLQRIRRMFNRIQLEEMEVNILRGILTEIERSIVLKGGTTNES